MAPLTTRATRVALVALAALAVTAGGSSGARAQERAGERPGRADYIAVGCHQCHGLEGQGGSRAGPRIAPSGLSSERFARIVRIPISVMPAYSPKVLTDARLKRIYDYVASIPEPPDLASIPAFRERGSLD